MAAGLREGGYEFGFCGGRSLRRGDPAVGEVPREVPDFLSARAAVPQVHRTRIGCTIALCACSHHHPGAVDSVVASIAVGFLVVQPAVAGALTARWWFAREVSA